MLKYIHSNKTFSLLLAIYCVMLYTSLLGYNVYFQLLLSVLVLLLLPLKSRYFTLESKLIVLFSATYSIIFTAKYQLESTTLLLLYTFSPISFYIWGKHCVDKLKTKDIIDWFVVCTIILLGLQLYLFVLKDIINNGYISAFRNLNVFGNQEMSATLLGIDVSLGFIGLTLFFTTKKNKIKAWLYLFAFIASIITVTHMINRTGLVIAATWTLLFFIIYNRNSFSKSILLIAFFSILVLVLYLSGIIDETLFDKYSARNEEEGLDARSEKWALALEYIFEYPFGWDGLGTIKYSSFVHNTWLDIARVSGFIPMLIFCVFTIRNIFNSYKLVSIDKTLNYISIVGLNFCFLCSFMVEPVIEGLPLYFYLWFMLCGVQEGVLEKLKYKYD